MKFDTEPIHKANNMNFFLRNVYSLIWELIIKIVKITIIKRSQHYRQYDSFTMIPSMFQFSLPSPNSPKLPS